MKQMNQTSRVDLINEISNKGTKRSMMTNNSSKKTNEDSIVQEKKKRVSICVSLPYTWTRSSSQTPNAI